MNHALVVSNALGAWRVPFTWSLTYAGWLIGLMGLELTISAKIRCLGIANNVELEDNQLLCTLPSLYHDS
jgi:hypothetical protein